MSLFAIIRGAFELDSDLFEAIVHPRRNWSVRENTNPRVFFSFDSPLLSATASEATGPLEYEPGYDPKIKQPSSIYFTICKENTPKALVELMRLTVRLMKATEADLLLEYLDTLKLARRRGKLMLYRLLPEPDDLWDSEGMLAQIPTPYDWVRLPEPPWYEEIKALRFKGGRG